MSALAALDDYRVRFPNGGLAPEAAMLRAEALLQIGRKGDALAELDRLSLGEMPNSDERYLLRGELRAAAGRWREALGDFDVVLRGQVGGKAEIVAATDVKLGDRWNARCGAEPWPAVVWATTPARARICKNVSAAFLADVSPPRRRACSVGSVDHAAATVAPLVLSATLSTIFVVTTAEAAPEVPAADGALAVVSDSNCPSAEAVRQALVELRPVGQWPALSVAIRGHLTDAGSRNRATADQPAAARRRP